jgi:hypothetical protein
MKKIIVKISKQTGYPYLEAKTVKEHIDALEKRIKRLEVVISPSIPVTIGGAGGGCAKKGGFIKLDKNYNPLPHQRGKKEEGYEK